MCVTPVLELDTRTSIWVVSLVLNYDKSVVSNVSSLLILRDSVNDNLLLYVIGPNVLYVVQRTEF